MSTIQGTPQFEQLLGASQKSSDVKNAYDTAAEENKEAQECNKSSFIDLNDDNIVYAGKKAYSPILAQNKEAIAAGQVRTRQSFN